MERTEYEKIAQCPIEIILGGQKYEVKPLSCRKATEWRKAFREEQRKLSAMPDTDAYVQVPDMLIKLICAYAPNINDSDFDNATDVEVAKAYVEVLKVANPFGKILQTLQESISA